MPPTFQSVLDEPVVTGPGTLSKLNDGRATGPVAVFRRGTVVRSELLRRGAAQSERKSNRRNQEVHFELPSSIARGRADSPSEPSNASISRAR